MKQRTTKKTVLDTIAIYFIKKVSNYLWEIADTWSYKNEKIAQLYNKFIEKEYRKEYENCDVHGNVDILHIGCGAYPLTDIVLASCSTGHIVGIDKNPQTVKRAQQIIQKNKLENRILIKHGDGQDYSVNNFDFIIISSCSLPKVKILNHIFQKAKSPSTIIVREVDIATNDILQCIDAYEGILIKKQVHHNPFPFFEPIGWTTFYLEKK
jgi:protein-L-isoaspartate O-methyltransferase